MSADAPAETVGQLTIGIVGRVLSNLSIMAQFQLCEIGSITLCQYQATLSWLPALAAARGRPYLRVQIKNAKNGTRFMEELKLIALDKDDIAVVSAHVQDALVTVGDIFWQPRERRFVMALNRFDWITAADADNAKPVASKATIPDYRRCRTALRFERVSACRCRDLDQSDKGATLNLLAVEFAERDAPAGTVTLTFSGGGAVRLEVECLEAELVDLGEVYAAAVCPDHFGPEMKTA